MGRCWGWAAAFGAVFWISTVAAQLPPTAQRDLLELRMVEQVGKEKYADYLATLRQFRALGGKPGLEMNYYEGVALARTGDPVAAASIVAAFVDRAGRAHPLYRDALALHAELEPRVKAAQARDGAMKSLATLLAAGRDRMAAQHWLPLETAWAAQSGLKRAEAWYGVVAMPDGGFITYGRRPEGDSPGPWPGFSDPEHPPAALMLHDSAGNMRLRRTYNLRVPATIRLRTRVSDTAGLGVVVWPLKGPGEVLGFAPGSPLVDGGPPGQRLRIGDVITHVNGDALDPDDNFFDAVRDAGSRVSLTVTRPGHDGVLTVTALRSGDVRGYVWWSRQTNGAVGASASDLGERMTDYRWGSDVVAVVPGSNGGYRACFNVGKWPAPYSYAGFWAELDAKGQIVGPLWAMPEDDPNDGPAQRTRLYDSRLMACAALPDGSLLTVSRAIPRLIKDDRVTYRGLIGSREPSGYDVRVFRIIGPDGAIRATLRLGGLGELRRELAPFQPRTDWLVWDEVHSFHRVRLTPAAGDSDWMFNWGPWLIDASNGQLREAGRRQPLVDVRKSADGTTWLLHAGGRDYPLAAVAGVARAWITASARWGAGDRVAVVNLNLVPGAPRLDLPGGGHLDDEVTRTHGQAIALLVGIEPAAPQPLWAVPLRHRIRRADSSPAASDSEWANLAVLKDGAIFVQVPAGPGMFVRKAVP